MHMDEYSTQPFEPESDAAYDWDYEAEPAPKILWGRVAALGGAVLIAFLIGRASAPDPPIEARELREIRDRLATAQTEVETLQGNLARAQREAQQAQQAASEAEQESEEAPAQPESSEEGDSTLYTVESGDSLSGLAEERYGDPDLYNCIAAANNLSPNAQLDIGDEIVIPSKEVCLSNTA